MDLSYIIDRYGLEHTNTGGNCTALYHELNTNQDHLYITDGDCSAPSEKWEEIHICVYLDSEFGEPAFIYVVETLDHLNHALSHIYELWGY